MIHQLLPLDKPLFVLDIEATSLDVQVARIVELAFQRWDATGMTKEWSSRINPGIPIPASATAVHGITDTDVADRPTFKQVAENLAGGLMHCDFAGQNVRYDLRVLDAEFRRAGVPWSYAGARVIDSSRIEALAVPRSLQHLHEKYVGLPHDGAHGALSDVRAMTTVISMQLKNYPSLPRDLDKLHEACWPGMIDSEGKFRFINGVPCVAFGKWRDKPFSTVESSYWAWIIHNDFSPEVKAIAQDAALKRFPEVKR